MSKIFRIIFYMHCGLIEKNVAGKQKVDTLGFILSSSVARPLAREEAGFVFSLILQRYAPDSSLQICTNKQVERLRCCCAMVIIYTGLFADFGINPSRGYWRGWR